MRALTPLSPVHLRETIAPGGDRVYSWIRRGRVDADSWLAADIPLGEDLESYSVKIRRTDGAVLRETTVGIPSWTYSGADILSDFPTASEFDVSISQISAVVGEGIAATARCSSA